MTIGRFRTITKAPRAGARIGGTSRGRGPGLPVGASAGPALGLRSSDPTRHTTGIASPLCLDRLPSHISKMAVSTVSGGGPDLTVDSTVNRWRSYWTGLVVASLAKDALPVTLVGHFPSAPDVDVQRIGPLQLASEYDAPIDVKPLVRLSPTSYGGPRTLRGQRSV